MSCINAFDKIVSEEQQREWIWNQRIFLHKSLSERRWFKNGIHSWL